MKRLLFCIVIFASLQSCSERAGIAAVANTNWVLSEWPGETMPSTDKKATLNFGADGRVTGKSFCNGFGGTATITGNQVKFGELIGTRMFCEDVGMAEGKYTEALGKANSFKVAGGKLHLLNGTQVLLTFNRAQ